MKGPPTPGMVLICIALGHTKALAPVFMDRSPGQNLEKSDHHQLPATCLRLGKSLVDPDIA